ncbi:hypothetical protein AtNW77_Chr2g0236721 [Arabidopsis thaliana]|uniref:Transmembrane protein n=1 Tax=Arabidopsis thaliana x Arabidopsis arenosa TaxID=1240361 RepID=A0A8T2FK03_9BRAS|nr:hypothetical protein ISN45_At02g012600 [Arabidopsis thaliana x Arabidopsis arenosa]
MSKSSGLTLPDFSIHLGSNSPLRTYKSFLIFFFFLFFFFDLGSKLTFDFFFFFLFFFFDLGSKLVDLQETFGFVSRINFAITKRREQSSSIMNSAQLKLVTNPFKLTAKSSSQFQICLPF